MKAVTVFRLSALLCAALVVGITAKPYKPWRKLTDEGFQETVVSMDDKGKISWEAEVDKDDLAYHVDVDYYEAMEKVQEYLSPLVAKYDDMVYYQDSQHPPVQKEPLGREIMGAHKVRVHFEPEEDRDDLFHRHVPQFVPYQMDDKAAAPVDGPFQKEYSEPEEDLDSLYHK